MGFYDISYSRVVTNLLPIQWRLTKHQAWLNTILYPIQWLRDKFFDNYVDTQIYYYYISGSKTCNKGDLIRFTDNSVWECQINTTDINSFNPIVNGSGVFNGVVYWVKILDDAIGLTERLSYNSQKLLFEYLLNRYYNPKGYVNAIYIDTQITNTKMYIALTDTYSSTIPDHDKSSLFFIGGTDTIVTLYDFTVYVPIQITTDLGVNWEKQISATVDKYRQFGLTYNIETY